jgi:hypothetical protein
MLSEFIPVWLPTLFASIQNVALGGVPAKWKPLSLFVLVIVAVAIIAAITGLTWEQVPEQVVILWGIVVGGYTVAKSAPAGDPKAAALIVAAAFGIIVVGRAVAGDPPVEQTANIWIAWLFGVLGGWLGRQVKRLPGA